MSTDKYPKYDIGDIIIDRLVETAQLKLNGMSVGRDRHILILGYRTVDSRANGKKIPLEYNGLDLDTGETILDMPISVWDTAPNVDKVA